MKIGERIKRLFRLPPHVSDELAARAETGRVRGQIRENEVVGPAAVRSPGPGVGNDL